MKKVLQALLPLAIVGLAVATAVWMKNSRKPPDTRPVEPPIPLVRAIETEVSDLSLSVRTHGTVRPRAEGSLVSEVSGRVVEVSPSLVGGGFFEEGEVLLEIDPIDFELAAVHARSRVAGAKARLQMEEAEADVARREWKKLGQGEPGPLVLRGPQMAEARAALASAEATLKLAERDLERTSLRAPYAGRVMAKSVAVGDYAARGVPLARIYAIDYAEVRIPVPDAQLAYLEIPLFQPVQYQHGPAPEVRLRARFAGEEHEWIGRIVRTEGEIDPQSRMVTAIARVDDPYGRDEATGRPPLSVGMFVEAEIVGREAKDVIVLPRAALRGGDRVYVIGADGRLRFRQVDVLRFDVEEVVIRSGLVSGEKICLSPLEAATDGMKVRLDAGAAAPEAPPEEKSP